MSLSKLSYSPQYNGIIIIFYNIAARMGLGYLANGAGAGYIVAPGKPQMPRCSLESEPSRYPNSSSITS